MSWEDVVCICLVAIGVILFLYGSNYYDAIVGWIGIFTMAGSILAAVIIRVYNSFKKRRTVRKS